MLAIGSSSAMLRKVIAKATLGEVKVVATWNANSMLGKYKTSILNRERDPAFQASIEERQKKSCAKRGH